MIELFDTIIKYEDEPKLIAYLQSISVEKKKELTPQIKKLAKEYSQFGQLKGNNYGYINGTDKQRELVQMASFVCFNRVDYEKTPFANWTLDKVKLLKIIDWYCPSWFSDFVNKLATRDFLPIYLNYDWVMELSAKGFLNPSKELIVQLMPQLIFELDKNRKWFLKPENLLKYPITLEEHIWHLFQEESGINNSERFHFDGSETTKEKIGWTALFKKFSADKIIDRSRLLKESLLASNRNFNKPLSGWFSNLFIELDPSKKEILDLRNELFSVLSSPNSKPVNTSLQFIKKIINEEIFDASGFLDAAPLLLSSDTKSTIISSLMILEKIASKKPTLAEQIVITVSQCFIHPEEEVQSRATRIIEKYGDSSNPVLRREMTAIYPSMLATARETLRSYYETVISNNNSLPDEELIVNKIGPVSELNEIPFPTNLDDLVFLASQAFDNNEQWHIDMLPAALLKFRPLLNEKNIPLFEPAFQKAFALLKNNFRSTTGNLDHLLAIFFIDFGNWLIRRFPNGSDSIRDIYRKHDTTDGNRQTSYLVLPSAGSYTAIWGTNNKFAFYEPFRQLLIEALGKLKQENNLPLLSTPTHSPSWISPIVLIDRLYLYQQDGQIPEEMDFQIALSRAILDSDQEPLKYSKEKLVGEFREIINFLLDETAAPQKPFLHRAAWMVASLTKREKKVWSAFDSFSYSKKPLNNYTGNLQWNAKQESYINKTYDYNLQKYVNTPATRKIVTVQKEISKSEKSGLNKFLSKLLPESKEDPLMLYDCLHFSSHYILSEYNDIKRILSLTPNNPEPILIDTLNKCLKHPEFGEEGDKKMVIAIIQFLFETWKKPGEMAHLFIGSSMLSSDKTVVNIAGEVWLTAVNTKSINNSKLGEVIGLIERIEFAPLKRFTDMISQNLFRVSELHNHQLQILIENIMIRLPDEPIKNLKKLLEIYRELVPANNNGTQLPEIKSRLIAWKNVGNLQKIVLQIDKDIN